MSSALADACENCARVWDGDPSDEQHRATYERLAIEVLKEAARLEPTP